MKKICETEDCESDDIIECFIDDIETGKKHKSYHCAKHCQDEGFCCCCGGFFGGIEEFDFNNPSGLCGLCKDQIDSNLCSDDHSENHEFEYGDPYEHDQWEAAQDMERYR